MNYIDVPSNVQTLTDKLTSDLSVVRLGLSRAWTTPEALKRSKTTLASFSENLRQLQELVNNIEG